MDVSQLIEELRSISPQHQPEVEMVNLTRAARQLSQTSDSEEFLAFLLDNNDRPHDFVRCHLFLALSQFRSSKWVSAHREQILPLLHRFLISRYNFPKEILILLISICDVTEDDYNKDTTLLSDIWKESIKLASSTDKASAISPALHTLCLTGPFRSYDNNEDISTFIDLDSDFDARINAIKPILRLFPFLSDSTILTILGQIIDILQENYYEAVVLLDHLDEADLSLLGETTVPLIFEAIVSKLNDPETHDSALALSSPFLELFLQDSPIPEAERVFIDAITVSLSPTSSDLSSTIACGVLRSMIRFFSEKFSETLNEKRSTESDNLFSALLMRITSEDETLALEANHAVRELFFANFCLDPLSEKLLLSKFNEFKENNRLHAYGKIFRDFLSNYEDPGIEICEPIFDLGLSLLPTPHLTETKEKTLAENALGLDIFAALCDSVPEFVEDHIDDAYPAVEKLLEPGAGDLCTSSALFLASVSNAFGLEETHVRDKVLEYLPKLSNIIEQHSFKCDLRAVASVAESTATICSVFDIRDISGTIAEKCLDIILKQLHPVRSNTYLFHHQLVRSKSQSLSFGINSEENSAPSKISEATQPHSTRSNSISGGVQSFSNLYPRNFENTPQNPQTLPSTGSIPNLIAASKYIDDDDEEEEKETIDDPLLTHCSSAVARVSRSLLPDAALNVFDNCMKLSLEIENEIAVDNLLKAMKRILKKYRVPEDLALKTAHSIISGRFPSVGELSKVTNEESYALGYLSTFITKFKKNAEEICAALLAVTPKIEAEGVIPAFLDPISAAIDQKSLSNEFVSKAIVILTSLLKISDQSVLSAVITVMVGIHRNYTRLVDSAALMKHLSAMWNHISPDDDEPDLPASIASLSLELVSFSPNSSQNSQYVQNPQNSQNNSQNGHPNNRQNNNQSLPKLQKSKKNLKIEQKSKKNQKKIFKNEKSFMLNNDENNEENNLDEEIYVPNEEEIKMIGEIIGAMPMPADVCDLEHISDCVLKIIKMKWSETIEIPIADFASRVILLKPSDLASYDLTPDILAGLKTILPILAKKNSVIESGLNARFSDSKAHQALLKTILK